MAFRVWAFDVPFASSNQLGFDVFQVCLCVLVEWYLIHSAAAAFAPITSFASIFIWCIQFICRTGQLLPVVNQRSEWHSLQFISELPLTDVPRFRRHNSSCNAILDVGMALFSSRIVFLFGTINPVLSVFLSWSQPKVCDHRLLVEQSSRVRTIAKAWRTFLYKLLNDTWRRLATCTTSETTVYRRVGNTFDFLMRWFPITRRINVRH